MWLRWSRWTPPRRSRQSMNRPHSYSHTIQGAGARKAVGHRTMAPLSVSRHRVISGMSVYPPRFICPQGCPNFNTLIDKFGLGTKLSESSNERRAFGIDRLQSKWQCGDRAARNLTETDDLKSARNQMGIEHAQSAGGFGTVFGGCLGRVLAATPGRGFLHGWQTRRHPSVRRVRSIRRAPPGATARRWRC